VKEQLPFTCRDVHVCAAAWLDEQLSPAEYEFIEEHLRNCPECEGYLQKMAEQEFEAPQLKFVQDEAYWQNMDQALLEELEQEEKRRTPIPWSMIALYAAALLLSVLWGVQHRQRASHLEKIVESQQQSLEYWERISQKALKEDEQIKPVKYVPARMEL
jgi:predicted anti-sigma-YlaC factor YlaD